LENRIKELEEFKKRINIEYYPIIDLQIWENELALKELELIEIKNGK
jgi:hypothetical protein